jgi:hypothetical protein
MNDCHFTGDLLYSTQNISEPEVHYRKRRRVVKDRKGKGGRTRNEL